MGTSTPAPLFCEQWKRLTAKWSSIKTLSHRLWPSWMSWSACCRKYSGWEIISRSLFRARSSLRLYRKVWSRVAIQRTIPWTWRGHRTARRLNCFWRLRKVCFGWSMTWSKQTRTCLRKWQSSRLISSPFRPPNLSSNLNQAGAKLQLSHKPWPLWMFKVNNNNNLKRKRRSEIQYRSTLSCRSKYNQSIVLRIN